MRFCIINGLVSSTCRSRCWKPKPVIFLLYNNGLLATSGRVQGRASYFQPASLFVPGCNQELQTMEILISAFEGNHLFPQMTHFRMYLWFRVDWERFPDTTSWGTMARCHCLRGPRDEPRSAWPHGLGQRVHWDYKWCLARDWLPSPHYRFFFLS